MTGLLVVGAGGFSRETAEAVLARRAAGGPDELLGFLDDDTSLHGASIEGVPVLGPLERCADFPDARVVVCVGSPRDFSVRRRIVARLGLPVERYATVVHPSAAFGRSVRVGHGTVVLATAVATAAVHVGAHVAVMPQVVLTHDDVVEDYATLGAGVLLAGNVRVGEGAYVGAGACVREHCHIGPGALVGMGAVVTRDVPAGQVWAGVPAAPLARSSRIGVPP